MHISQSRPDSVYPAPPWEMLGHGWAGVFPADRPHSLPGSLRAILGSNWRLVMLLRYREGPLRYDELVVGTVVTVGLHVGVYVQDIWVNSLPSLAGGRAIWGLPKQLATFTWHDNRVVIADDAGALSTIHCSRSWGVLPPLPLPVIGIGGEERRPLLFPIQLWTCLGWAGMHLEAWSGRKPYRLAPKPLLSFAIRPFRATFRAPLLP
jgi:hypothetical protein